MVRRLNFDGMSNNSSHKAYDISNHIGAFGESALDKFI